ncbi:hypothetical protein PoB_007424400 [Plakobranchus ocellatus]|uniref:Uncharacterized protein n=1 Tax=Plakobranchus ocellatus TaxID=259542 RepID=A0AAV4DU38_9GAST|nr:hypothetical protein PoB_007424400 [Plakobranchus ocellatus]
MSWQLPLVITETLVNAMANRKYCTTYNMKASKTAFSWSLHGKPFQRKRVEMPAWNLFRLMGLTNSDETHGDDMAGNVDFIQQEKSQDNYEGLNLVQPGSFCASPTSSFTEEPGYFPAASGVADRLVSHPIRPQASG